MSSSTTHRTPLETFEEFVRTYNTHDMEANHALISPSFVRYGLTTGWQPMGFDSYKGIFKPFEAAFPDFNWEVTNIVASGEWVAAEIIETGTFTGAYEYRPDIVFEPTGQSYLCHYSIFVKVVDGLIAEYRLYEDSSFPFQLGIDINKLLEGMAT